MKSSCRTLLSLGLYSWGSLLAAFPTWLLRCTALTALFFFTWAALEPWNFAKAAPAAPQQQTPSTPKPRQQTEKFEHALRNLKKKVSTSTQQEQSERQALAASDASVSDFEAEEKAIGEADAEILEQFRETEHRIKAAGLPAEILHRHNQAVAEYQANAKALRQRLRTVTQLKQDLTQAERQNKEAKAKTTRSEMEQQLRELNGFLKEKVKEPPHKPLDPNNLPFRVPKVQERKPRLKKEQFTELQKPIQLAFNGSLSPQLVAQVNSDLPTPQDLAETIDVQFTQGVRDLATFLGSNPLAIFNWVRQNIAFVPTFGSIQGSEACRISKECNAYDTASLLIALLRVSGIPARYVIGTVEVKPDLFRSAMGDFQDLRAAVGLAASGGIPVALVNDAARNPVAVEMEHVWVEAYVDYVPSRGVVKGAGDHWVPLDAVLKPTRFQAPIDKQAALGIDLQAIYEDFLATSTVGADGNSVAKFTTSATETQVTTLSTQFQNYLNTNHPDVTIGEVIGAVEIEAQPLSLLPVGLPGKILVVGSRLSELPSESRSLITLQIIDASAQLEQIHLEYSTVELAGKRITLAYLPATETDLATINSYGGILKVPPYLLQVKPTVYIEGVPVGTGSAVTMGVTLKIEACA